jgi:hypothetical protein
MGADPDAFVFLGVTSVGTMAAVIAGLVIPSLHTKMSGKPF